MSKRVRHWQPAANLPGYETRINAEGYRETRPIQATGIPAGFTQVPNAVVFMSKEEIIVLGEPDGEDESEDGHNCDAMGCGWNHVLYRHRLRARAGTSEQTEDSVVSVLCEAAATSCEESAGAQKVGHLPNV